MSSEYESQPQLESSQGLDGGCLGLDRAIQVGENIVGSPWHRGWVTGLTVKLEEKTWTLKEGLSLGKAGGRGSSGHVVTKSNDTQEMSDYRSRLFGYQVSDSRMRLG